MENTKYLYKNAFAVIGKSGQGTADNPQKWILPLWNEANANFMEIAGVIRKNENGAPFGVWGAMNDMEEGNKRWGETGKYMAGCEADIDAQPPEGWTKWIIPAQTYMVVKCTMEEYSQVFGKITNTPEIQITGTVHERYPEPGNPNIVELYFPIAEGMMFCQSCGMPLSAEMVFGKGSTEEVLGREKNGSLNPDYCYLCYADGEFTTNGTMEEMIESCVPYTSNNNPWPDEEMARKEMQKFFPKLKRWAK